MVTVTVTHGNPAEFPLERPQEIPVDAKNRFLICGFSKMMLKNPHFQKLLQCVNLSANFMKSGMRLLSQDINLTLLRTIL